MNIRTDRSGRAFARLWRLAFLGATLPLTVQLAACGFGSPPPPVATPPGPVEAYMISARPGQSTTLDDPQCGSGLRLSVDELFTSARGEECKRGTVLMGQKEAEVIVICRDAQGQWKMAPRVWGQGIAAP